MNFKELLFAISKGAFDSIKGIYWLFTLDSAQRKAHQDRTQFHDLNRKNKTAIRVNKEEPRILKRVLQCCSLNGLVFAASVLLFNNVVLPLLQIMLITFFDSSTQVWYWTQVVLQVTFGTLWIIPLYILSLTVNALWFQDIGTLAYRYSIGRPKRFANLSVLLADSAFSVVIQFLFLIQAKVVMFIPIPILNQFLFLFHTCLLYSLYSFEYKWIHMGWPLHQRLAYLESNWPYFIGFGLPLALITFWPNDLIIGGCCFSVFFPLFIISGIGNDVGAVVEGTPRVQLFSLVVGITNVISKESITRVQPRTKVMQSNQQQPIQYNNLMQQNRPKVIKR